MDSRSRVDPEKVDVSPLFSCSRNVRRRIAFGLFFESDDEDRDVVGRGFSESVI